MMMMTSHQLIKTFSPNFVLFVAQTIYGRTARAKFVVSLKTKKIYIYVRTTVLCASSIYIRHIYTGLHFRIHFLKPLFAGVSLSPCRLAIHKYVYTSLCLKMLYSCRVKRVLSLRCFIKQRFLHFFG